MDTVRTLQSAKLRNTAGRRAVLAYMTTTATPVSIEDIEKNASIAQLSLDQATIYRIVNTLTEKGLLRAVNFQEGKTRFELASHPHHHHVVCTNCGTVEDVKDCLKPAATTQIEKETGFTITSHALEFFGLCPKCQAR
jgi:Fur family ferric uptake transcriptional regulator